MSQPVANGDAWDEKQPEAPLPPPPGANVEAGVVGPDAGETARPASNFRGLSTLQQWKEGDWMKKAIVGLRALALLFSFLSFIIMVTNIRGYYIGAFPANFNVYEQYNYMLVVAIFAMVYTAVQTGIKIHQLRTGKELIPSEAATLVDFIGDQIMAYLLISSASAGTPTVDGLRKFIVDPFIDQLTASISMSFLAFFSLAPAALLSGYSLSIQLSKS